jgi:hypothetical protein
MYKGLIIVDEMSFAKMISDKMTVDEMSVRKTSAKRCKRPKDSR